MFGLPFALAYNTNGFAHHSLAGCAVVLKSLGYEGISLTLDVAHANPFTASDDEWRGIRRLFDRMGLRRSIETGARFLLDPMRKHEPSLVSPEGRERRIAFLERSIGIADRIGAECVSLWAGRPHPGVPRRKAFGWLVEGCARIAKSAARRKVALALEPEPGMLVETLAQWRRLRDAVSAQNLKLTLDVGHVRCSERIGIPRAIRESAADLANVHLDDVQGRVHEHLPPGRGAVAFGPVVRALAEIRYGGLASLELSRDSHRAVDAAREAMAFLRPLLRRAV